MRNFFKIFLTVDYLDTYSRQLWNRYHKRWYRSLAKKTRPDRIHPGVYACKSG